MQYQLCAACKIKMTFLYCVGSHQRTDFGNLRGYLEYSHDKIISTSLFHDIAQYPVKGWLEDKIFTCSTKKFGLRSLA